ncbi:glycerol kinase 2 [Bacteroidia bacterium]|nr:glycerol kinase 2 [Bacteroidia bacterium]
MKYTLAIDQSTSATKAMLFDANAALVARVSLAHEQFYPRPGWVEHDPVEILENTCKAVSNLLEESKITPSDIVSLALTNQRETVVMWDKSTGKPVYNAIVWQCNRGAAICEEIIAQGKAALVKEKTGLIINPYFSASGVKWIIDNIVGTHDVKTRRATSLPDDNLLIGTIDTWLIWNFTGGAVHATDYTNASRTLLFNIHTLDWDDELLELFSVNRSMLPEVYPCDHIFGTTTLNGLLPEIPIAGVLGDSHGALVGQMCFAPGMGKATYGTGSSLMINIGEEVLEAPEGLVTSVAFSALDKTYYAFEGNIHCTGATIQWLKNNLQFITSAQESEVLATAVEDNGGVYFVPAFAGLGAPWWNNEAKALICGMTGGTTKAHIVRAALESIAYQIKDLMDLVRNAGGTLQELRVDGGPVKNNFLMQFQADMLQAPINRSPIEEASVLGAVLMNSIALKTRHSWDELAQLRKEENRIYPQMDTQKTKSLHQAWIAAVKRTII